MWGRVREGLISTYDIIKNERNYGSERNILTRLHVAEITRCKEMLEMRKFSFHIYKVQYLFFSHKVKVLSKTTSLTFSI